MEHGKLAFVIRNFVKIKRTGGKKFVGEIIDIAT